MKARARPPDAERRERAEARLATLGHEPEKGSRLEHELRVHQVELEMQNEELRAARAQVEAGLRRYTELFDFAPVGYAVLDSAGTLLEANLELARMAGVPRGNLIGWSFAAFVDASHRTALRDFLRARLVGGAGQPSASLEVTFAPDTAEPIPVRLVASAHAGAEPSVLVAVHDLTATKGAELAREESARKDEFLAALSHELRNPLTPIRIGLSVLDMAEPGSAESRKAVATIDRQVGHLVHIVDDLLDVTRVARGKVVLRRERLALGPLVREVVADHRAEFEAKQIALDCGVDDEPMWVDADATRLVQVVGNLLVNAAKFTSAGGHVHVGLRRERGSAVLSVRDDGVGIAGDLRDSLFVPFIQGPQSLDRSHGGLGLGLAMVKGLAELHGGSVDVSSAGADRGSEFTVRLPLVEAPLVGAKVSAPVAPVTSPAGGAKRRVLVIEDNVDAADAMRELFAYLGHDTRVAHDGAAGLAQALEFRPEIVFCDLGLPEMDGFSVARAMRSERSLKDAYLVALSGYARAEDRERSARAGFDVHLAKPPSTEELEEVLSRGGPESRATACV